MEMEMEMEMTTPTLRDFLLKRKLNLSQKSWNQLNNRWHDEIYNSKQRNPYNSYFKKYHANLLEDSYPVCIWKSNTIEKIKPTSSPLFINLESQITDLNIKVAVLSIVNIGLVVMYILKT